MKTQPPHCPSCKYVERDETDSQCYLVMHGVTYDTYARDKCARVVVAALEEVAWSKEVDRLEELLASSASNMAWVELLPAINAAHGNALAWRKYGETESE